MFPTRHDPASPFCILAPAYNPIFEQHRRGAGDRRGWGFGGPPHPGLPREHSTSAMKPCGCGASPGILLDEAQGDGAESPGARRPPESGHDDASGVAGVPRRAAWFARSRWIRRGDSDADLAPRGDG